MYICIVITVPPQKPTIFDGQARELGGIAGPFNEGSSMTLTCIASGGKCITIKLFILPVITHGTTDN